ncbi:hypothetical protein PybrP1_000609 [[Pythium] brassicae (nom. inval.)]|nr:hypothetical protein PybrP1_000609 [[Pythium] brassicae (nom. inval.)]
MWTLLLPKISARVWLSVALDQSAYTAGDLVRGRVTLSVSEDIVGDELVVRVRGQERISWVEEVEVHSKKGGSRTKHKPCSRTNEFLLDRLRLFAFPRAFRKGEQYEFAFVYQTHASLPGVFSLGTHAHSVGRVRDLCASISYSVRATLDQGHYLFDCWNAHARCDLVLHGLPKTGAPFRASAFAGTYDATSQSVRLLSLLSQGQCEVAVSLDKPAYASGATAHVQYHVKNASRVDIRALSVTLYHDVYLRLGKHARDPISTRVASFAFAGVSSESEASASEDIALVHARDGVPLAPATTGSLIRSGYRVHVHCDIPWSPDVALDLPILITSPAAAAAIATAAPVPTTAVEAIPVAVPVPMPVATAVPVGAPSFAFPDVHAERDAAVASAIHY